MYHTNSYFVCDNISKTNVKIHHNLTAISNIIRVELDSILITILYTYNTLLYRFLCSFYTVYNMVVVYIRTFLMDGVGIITAINSVTMDDFYHYLLSLFK